MNATKKCGHCSAPLSEGESDAYCPVCLLNVGLSASVSSIPAEPTESVGRYQLLEKIGQGGMGQVYKARDSQLGRTVAIKFLPMQMVDSDENLKRFQREASTLSRVSHQNICIVYDVGNSDRGPYIVMEYVRGRALSAILDSEGIRVDQAIDIMLQICAGIEVIHEKGIIHRDIKPSNVMLTDKNIVKLVDFGLAKWNANPDSDWTEHDDALRTRAEFVKTVPGQVVGTPSYMSPEQAAGTAVDVRSDIFSIGALFYGMLAGEPPFRGETPMLTIHSIISRKYRPIREVNPDLPASLEAIVDRMLGDLDERFQSIEELVPRLKQEQAALGVGQSTSEVESKRTSSDPDRSGRGPVTDDPVQKKSALLESAVRAMSTRFLLVGGGLLVCLLLVFAVFFIPAYLGNLAGPENTGSAGQSPSPVELAGQPRVDPAPVVSPPEDFQPFDHHLVLGVIVDPTRFVDQRQPENQDVVVVDLHLKLQEELAGALGQAGFPVVPVKNEEWNGIQKSIVQEQGGFDYGLAVGSLLKEKQANLFLSLSGFRNDEKQTYQFELHFFNLAGAAFFVQKMEIPIGSVDEESESGARLMFEDWLSDMFEPERDVSTGASLEGGGEIPPIKGIVVLPAFEEGESPPSAFEFIDGQQRAQLQKQIAEKLRRQLFDLKPVSKTKITTPSLEEWRAARDVDSVETWEELLGPFDANAVLSIHGEYDETLMTYGVELELNQMGTIFLQGQHRFAYTEEEFRENFGEVALELLKAPILQGGKRPEEATGRD